MKKKILCVITKTDIGGAQKYVFDLAKNLDKNQFETKILCGGADIKWLSNKVWPFFLNDWLAIWELAKQDKKICVSEYDYNLALSCRIAPKEKLTTVHNGIDSNIKFLDKETAKNEITKKLQTTNYKLQTNYPWVGSIGRLVKEKNYETLILAAALVPNAYFFIIGEGPEYKNYKLQIINYKLQNRFFLINPTGNDAQYLKAFDIFTMSSVKEGLPYILLEAMAAELPIVVTEAGGMPEVIKNHENG